MGKIFIGGSRKWDMYPDDVIVDIDTRILEDIVRDAANRDDEIFVGDCPEGIDPFVVLVVMRINSWLTDPVKLTIVCNDKPRLTFNLTDRIKHIYDNSYINYINLREEYENHTADMILSEVLQSNDILNIDWSDQSIKDKYMMELCDIHRFIWNGSSRATERNIIYSYVEDSLIYIPVELSNGKVIWEASCN